LLADRLMRRVGRTRRIPDLKWRSRIRGAHRRLPDGREALEAKRHGTAFVCRRRVDRVRVDNAPGKAVELRRQLAVASQRQRHA
jgi:hypothetical protein